MISKDQYIAPLIMENKTITKKILATAGFKAPVGEEFHSSEKAKVSYWSYINRSIVIKPKSTNYGLGNSIFKNSPAQVDYDSAIDYAFKEDRAVLVEEFIEGTEYRFFVIAGEVAAILLRVPANVVGDGKRTIRELVAKKNKDRFRP
jgi:glutamate--cysteine ligase